MSDQSPSLSAAARPSCRNEAAAGGPERDVRTRRMWHILDDDPAFERLVVWLTSKDLVPEDAKASERSSDPGFGASIAGAQDTGAAMLDKQLISDQVVDIEEHIALALDLLHPDTSIFRNDFTVPPSPRRARRACCEALQSLPRGSTRGRTFVPST